MSCLDLGPQTTHMKATVLSNSLLSCMFYCNFCIIDCSFAVCCWLCREKLKKGNLTENANSLSNFPSFRGALPTGQTRALSTACAYLSLCSFPSYGLWGGAKSDTVSGIIQPTGDHASRKSEIVRIAASLWPFSVIGGCNVNCKLWRTGHSNVGTLSYFTQKASGGKKTNRTMKCICLFIFPCGLEYVTLLGVDG